VAGVEPAVVEAAAVGALTDSDHRDLPGTPEPGSLATAIARTGPPSGEREGRPGTAPGRSGTARGAPPPGEVPSIREAPSSRFEKIRPCAQKT
jgi:hypothetical protein